MVLITRLPENSDRRTIFPFLSLQGAHRGFIDLGLVRLILNWDQLIERTFFVTYECGLLRNFGRVIRLYSALIAQIRGDGFLSCTSL